MKLILPVALAVAIASYLAIAKAKELEAQVKKEG
jgi:hypothetical protein